MTLPNTCENINEDRSSFVVDNDSKADWAIKRIHEAEADIEKWKDYYAKKLKEIEESNKNTIEHFTHLLYDYFQTLVCKETATQQSYALPSGKLILKKPTVDYKRDDAALLLWAKEKGNSKFIKIKESVAWDEIKKEIKETGEIPDGVVAFEKPAEFKVR